MRIAFGVSPNGKIEEEGRKKRGCCSRVKMMSACENVTFESGRRCDRRAEDVGSPFSSSDEKKEKRKKKTGAPVINNPTLGKFYFGPEGEGVYITDETLPSFLFGLARKITA